MKVTVETAAFKDAATWAARYLAAKPDRPALAGLLLRAGDGGALTIVGADGDTWATARIEHCEVWDNGGAVLPGKLLADIAGRLAGDTVEISHDGTEATLACGALTLTVPTTTAEDYPTVPALPRALGSVGAGAFQSAVAQIAVAVAKDPKVPAATGLFFETTGDGLRLTAADGFRLARTLVTLTPEAGRDPGAAALLPGSTIAELARGLDGRVALHLDTDEPHALGFAWEGRQVTTPLLAVRPIAYDKALRIHDASEKARVDLDRVALLDALGRLSVVFDGKVMPRLHLALSAGQMTLQVRGGSSPRGRGAETLAVGYDRDERELQVNAHTLAEAVKSARGDVLHVDLTRTNAAFLRSDVDPNWVHLVILLKDPGAEVAA